MKLKQIKQLVEDNTLKSLQSCLAKADSREVDNLAKAVYLKKTIQEQKVSLQDALRILAKNMRRITNG